MAGTEAPRFAVYPYITVSDEKREPQLFESEIAARRFLNSEQTLRNEARETNSSIDDVRKRRQRRKQEGNEALVKLRRGELNPQNLPLSLYSRLHKDEGWKGPIPVRYFADYSGLICDDTFRSFLPLERVGSMMSSPIEDALARVWEQRSLDPICYLGNDWRFAVIASEARKRVGHEYAGRRHSQVADIVVRAIYDIEDLLRRLHPRATCGAVADFWRSWQVQRHIADFCVSLGESETAMLVARTLRVSLVGAVNGAHEHVNAQLSAFAYSVLDAEVYSTRTEDGLGGRPTKGKASVEVGPTQVPEDVIGVNRAVSLAGTKLTRIGGFIEEQFTDGSGTPRIPAAPRKPSDALRAHRHSILQAVIADKTLAARV